MPSEPVSLQNRSCKPETCEKLFPKAFSGGIEPRSRQPWSSSRTSMAGPGQSKSHCHITRTKAELFILGTAHHLTSMAGSISAEHWTVHWLRCWVRTHPAPVTRLVVVQPALPSASSLGEGFVPPMCCWAEKVMLKPFSSRKYFFCKDRISPTLIHFALQRKNSKYYLQKN